MLKRLRANFQLAHNKFRLIRLTLTNSQTNYTALAIQKKSKKMFIRSIILAYLASLATAGTNSIRVVGNRDLEGQPSAKFAAAWSVDTQVAGECINNDNPDMIDFWGSSSLVRYGWCHDVDSEEESSLALSQFAPMGRIKIPNNKEILITLSAQIDILTVNTATSQKKTLFDDQDYYGNIGATSAMAGVEVEIFAESTSDGTTTSCFPNKVVMASRFVELRNLIGGEVTYEDCEYVDQDPCPIKLANTTLSSTVGLAMDTAAAHSFQWVCTDMESDVYDIVAHFKLKSEVENLCDTVFGGDCTANADLAAARVTLGKRMMTIQEVRAVKDAFAEI